MASFAAARGRRVVVRALSGAAGAAKKDGDPVPPLPIYIRAAIAAVGASGLTVCGVLLLTHEPGIRYALEGVAPAVVEVVRARGYFLDEDAEARAYNARLRRELGSADVTARVPGGQAKVGPLSTLRDLERSLGLDHALDQLDATFDDLEGEPTDGADDAEDGPPPAQATAARELERLYSRQGAPSLWAEPTGKATAPTADQLGDQLRRDLVALEGRRADLDLDLRSGRRTVDDITAESQAIEARIRDLNRQLSPRRFYLF